MGKAKDNKEVAPKKPTADSKVEMIEVDKAKLAEFMDGYKDMKERLNRLESAGDVGRLAHYDEKKKKKGPNVFRLSTYTDPETGKVKIVTGWRTIKNISFKDPQTKLLREHQEYELLLEDNSTVKILGYKEFTDTRYANQILVEEVARITDDHGTALKVRTKDGRLIDIDINFVN